MNSKYSLSCNYEFNRERERLCNASFIVSSRKYIGKYKWLNLLNIAECRVIFTNYQCIMNSIG